MAKSLFLRCFLLALAFCPSFSTGYSWHLNTPPTQCSNLSITVTGSDGVPPYRVLIVPFGPSPLSSNIEIRSIIDQPFDGNSTTVEFPVNYPAHSYFIAVVRRRTSNPVASLLVSPCYSPYSMLVIFDLCRSAMLLVSARVEQVWQCRSQILAIQVVLILHNRLPRYSPSFSLQIRFINASRTGFGGTVPRHRG